jgi:hypothetical protein
MALKGQVDSEELANLRENVLRKKKSAGSTDLPLTVSLKKYSLPFLYSERTIVKLR